MQRVPVRFLEAKSNWGVEPVILGLQNTRTLTHHGRLIQPAKRKAVGKKGDMEDAKWRIRHAS
jgi:hypothetical protein